MYRLAHSVYFQRTATSDGIRKTHTQSETRQISAGLEICVFADNIDKHLPSCHSQTWLYSHVVASAALKKKKKNIYISHSFSTRSSAETSAAYLHAKSHFLKQFFTFKSTKKFARPSAPSTLYLERVFVLCVSNQFQSIRLLSVIFFFDGKKGGGGEMCRGEGVEMWRGGKVDRKVKERCVCSHLLRIGEQT